MPYQLSKPCWDNKRNYPCWPYCEFVYTICKWIWRIYHFVRLPQPRIQRVRRTGTRAPVLAVAEWSARSLSLVLCYVPLLCLLPRNPKPFSSPARSTSNIRLLMDCAGASQVLLARNCFLWLKGSSVPGELACLLYVPEPSTRILVSVLA